jgi:DNA polymerase III subunit delta'
VSADSSSNLWPIAPLPWQQGAWQQLTTTLEEGRFPHALLISGSSGIGKHHFSRALSALLLCQQPIAGTACGECRSCDLLSAGTHSDFMELTFEGDSRLIKVDQVRRLGEFLSKTAALGKNKMVLLRPADVMNLNAANALLKNLEEPRPGTYLVLVAEGLSRIMPTVRSRCQNLALADPDQTTSAVWLEQFVGEASLAREILALAGGKPLFAQELFENDKLDYQRALVKALEAVSQGTISPLEFPQLVADEELTEVLALLAGELERYIRDRVAGGERQLQPQFRVLDDLRLLRRRVIAGANPNRQLCIESAAIQVAQVVGATS